MENLFTDTDECTAGQHDCYGTQEVCRNTFGAYKCDCDVGFEWDRAGSGVCTGECIMKIKSTPSSHSVIFATQMSVTNDTLAAGGTIQKYNRVGYAVRLHGLFSCKIARSISFTCVRSGMIMSLDPLHAPRGELQVIWLNMVKWLNLNETDGVTDLLVAVYLQMVTNCEEYDKFVSAFSLIVALVFIIPINMVD